MMDIPQRDPLGGDKITSDHETNLRLFFAVPPTGKNPGLGMNPTDRDLKSALKAACDSNRFHPIRNYLNGCRWDGVPRLSRLFIDYLGTPDDAYHRQVARLVMVAGVARVFEPGCKFDHAVILEGAEGLGKSSFIRGLAGKPQWFGELHGRFNDRKGLVEQMQGAWMIEMPELSGFNKSAVVEVKAFMSARSDNVRLAYEARSMDFLRQCILWGSTNDRKYLQSETGDRRFFPIEVMINIDMKRLAANIDQIWAEAVEVYRRLRATFPLSTGDLPLYLRSPEAKRLALEYQGSRKVETVADIQAGQIQHIVDQPMTLAEITGDDSGKLDPEKYLVSKVCAAWIHERLGNDRPITRDDTSNYNLAMRKLKGWTETKGSLGFGKHGEQRGFKRIGATVPELRHGYMMKED